MNKTIILGSLILFPLLTFANDSQPDSDDEDYALRPVLLDSSDNNTAVLGLRYRAEKKWTFLENEQKPGPDATADRFGSSTAIEQMTDKHGFAELKLEGLWTNDMELNPESFSKLNLDIGYEISIPDDIEKEGSQEKDFDFGLQFALEGDQNYDNTQTVSALQAGAMFGDSTDWYIATVLAYGEVDASKDDARMALTNVDTFDRVAAEVHLQYQLKFREGRKYSPKSIAFNYRYYGEVDPPDAIKQADLDIFQRGVVRLKFEKGLYVAVSEGKLPFDLQSESVLEVGLSQNLF